MPSHPYIAIEGVIGVGKTTLTRLLQPMLQAEVALEVFEENPFLAKFYEDRERYAFQTQMFFLLSRYHQQMSITPQTLEKQPLVSDYTFAKDRLFAELNLQGDELEMYYRLHAALGEQITAPHLLIYLRADTNVLMERIASRGRSYERNMERQYIEQLGEAYETFAAGWDVCPLLTIDTNDMDIVSNANHLNQVLELVKDELGRGAYQQRLPESEPLEVSSAESHP